MEYIRLFFSYTVAVWNLPDSRVCDYTVCCKICGQNIHAPVQTMPDTWVVAERPLCGQHRAYLPPRHLHRPLVTLVVHQKASEIRAEALLMGLDSEDVRP